MLGWGGVEGTLNLHFIVEFASLHVSGLFFLINKFIYFWLH